jgi:hypothetical protein
LSTGIIATAIVLIVGYVIVSRIVGLTFRLVVPLVLLVVLGGAGAFSGLMPERSPADQYAPYDRLSIAPVATSAICACVTSPTWLLMRFAPRCRVALLS